MDNIQIDIGTKKVHINSGPEFIEFNPSDVTFAEKFYQLVKDFNAKQVIRDLKDKFQLARLSSRLINRDWNRDDLTEATDIAQLHSI